MIVLDVIEVTSGWALNLASKDNEAITVKECATYCSRLNYPMSGVEYSTEVCLCIIFLKFSNKYTVLLRDLFSKRLCPHLCIRLQDDMQRYF